jgi:hypothetical protein
MKKPHYDRITTTIEREWLAQSIARTKKIEYRQIKPYWTNAWRRQSRQTHTRSRVQVRPNETSVDKGSGSGRGGKCKRVRGKTSRCTMSKTVLE